MTDQPANTGEILEESSKPGTFKKGYDPRRWLKGQPKKPKDKPGDCGEGGCKM